MGWELDENPRYRTTMDRLEALKHKSDDGVEYWLAREIHTTLGYPVFQKFGPVIDRAREAFTQNKIEPSHHIARTSQMMGIGRGAKREGTDYFLSRAACYLIAMNGDPSKPEIAAAQAYFAVQTRRVERSDAASLDEKRLELREKIAISFKHVSEVAMNAGVRSRMQAIFHDARYHGLYRMSARDVGLRKGLKGKDKLFDRAGPFELSTNEFQMNLAADVIKNEGICGEQSAIQKNREIAAEVREVLIRKGATLPENLPLEEPIKDVKKRIKHQKSLPKTDPN